MEKLKKFLNNNNVLISIGAVLIAALLWIFNISATAEDNAKHLADAEEHIGVHCLRIAAGEAVDARLESKIDVLLLLYGIDPTAVKAKPEYLYKTRGIENTSTIDSTDIREMEEYLKDLYLYNRVKK